MLILFKVLLRIHEFLGTLHPVPIHLRRLTFESSDNEAVFDDPEKHEELIQEMK